MLAAGRGLNDKARTENVGDGAGNFQGLRERGARYVITWKRYKLMLRRMCAQRANCTRILLHVSPETALRGRTCPIVTLVAALALWTP
jgi:hypothetical protein